CRGGGLSRAAGDYLRSQGRQDSNLQPAVLETAALPIAPHPYAGLTTPGTVGQGSVTPTGNECTGTGALFPTRFISAPVPPRVPAGRPCRAPFRPGRWR